MDTQDSPLSYKRDSILIKRFDPLLETEVINHWLKEHNHPAVSEQDMAGMGYIAYLVEDWVLRHPPTACAFLRRCEGNLGILDRLCTNPTSPGPLRHLCIEMLVEKIIAKAEEYGMTHLMAWSVDKSTLERSQKHGFSVSNQVLITKVLNGICI